MRRKKNFFHVLIIKFNLYRYYLEIREELRDYRDMKINVMMQWSIIAMLEKFFNDTSVVYGCMLVSVMGVLENNLISIQLWVEEEVYVRFEFFFCECIVEGEITFVGGF